MTVQIDKMRQGFERMLTENVIVHECFVQAREGRRVIGRDGRHRGG
jgi:hypothetical protein